MTTPTLRLVPLTVNRLHPKSQAYSPILPWLSRFPFLCRAGPGGATPLRDVVGGLRQELQEKDLQLMQVGPLGSDALSSLMRR